MQKSDGGGRVVPVVLGVVFIAAIGGGVYASMADGKQMAGAKSTNKEDSLVPSSHSTGAGRFLVDAGGLSEKAGALDQRISELAERLKADPSLIRNADYLAAWEALKAEAADEAAQAHSLNPPEDFRQLKDTEVKIADKGLGACSAVAAGVKTNSTAKALEGVKLLKGVDSLVRVAEAQFIQFSKQELMDAGAG
jgi:hypothetical protein